MSSRGAISTRRSNLSKARKNSIPLKIDYVFGGISLFVVRVKLLKPEIVLISWRPVILLSPPRLSNTAKRLSESFQEFFFSVENSWSSQEFTDNRNIQNISSHSFCCNTTNMMLLVSSVSNFIEMNKEVLVQKDT